MRGYGTSLLDLQAFLCINNVKGVPKQTGWQLASDTRGEGRHPCMPLWMFRGTRSSAF